MKPFIVDYPITQNRKCPICGHYRFDLTSIDINKKVEFCPDCKDEGELKLKLTLLKMIRKNHDVDFKDIDKIISNSKIILI